MDRLLGQPLLPANEIVNLLPGELFVHRNIANVVVHSDLNFLSVMQFAVDVLKVKNIIVCGHYGCSGVPGGAALRPDRARRPTGCATVMQDVAEKHRRPAGSTRCAGEALRTNRLCELNVIEQVSNVCQTTIVRDAWHRGQPLTVHSWIYGLKDGLLRDLGMSILLPCRNSSRSTARRSPPSRRAEPSPAPVLWPSTPWRWSALTPMRWSGR